jgi:hypothetical protein
MPPVEFERTVPVFESTKSFNALDRATTVTGSYYLITIFLHVWLNVSVDFMPTFT